MGLFWDLSMLAAINVPISCLSKLHGPGPVVISQYMKRVGSIFGHVMFLILDEFVSDR